MNRNRLTARKVETAKPGKYEDGDGLRLVVAASGSRKWVLRYTRAGRRVEMGLGSVPTVGLADARQRAANARRLVKEGKDPVAVRRAERAAAAEGDTFGPFAERLIDTIETGFRNEKHRSQWRTTLTTYAAPIWNKRLADIETDDVLACLKPIWTAKAETASRVRGRIERVLDAAAARGLRSRDNPARWRGHLANLLPARQKLARGHHAAMPFAEVPAFLARLREVEGVSARALELAILTAARSGEVLGARWNEIDLDAKVWTVPASRMKAGHEHRVPLTERAVAILAALAAVKTGDHVFPGAKRGRPLSVMALAMVMRRMGVGEFTVHGFRSAFRDWAGERTNFAREVAEAALAHVVGDATERAYRRGDALETRRALMEAWAKFCELVGDRHEHEQNGAAASRDRTIDPVVGRKLLYNLLHANPGAMPPSLWGSAVEAVKALEYGETLPLLRAGRNRKRRYKQLQLQLEAIGFVEYRAELGGNKEKARDVVSAAFGQSSHTLRTWVDRLRGEFGVVHVLRVMETARNSAICVRRAQRGRLRGKDHSDSSDYAAATSEKLYGDEAIKAAGRKYLQLLGFSNPT